MKLPQTLKIALGLALALPFGGALRASVFTATPTADAWISSHAEANLNFGGQNADGERLRVRNHDAASNTRHRKSYLRFATGGAGQNPATAEEARFTLTLAASQSGTYRLYAINDGAAGDAPNAWSSTGITWNNAPQNDTASGAGMASGATLLGTFSTSGSAPAGQTVVIDSATLPALLTAVRADTNNSITFVITQSGTAGSSIDFASSRHGTLAAPQLRVVYPGAGQQIPGDAIFMTSTATGARAADAWISSHAEANLNFGGQNVDGERLRMRHHGSSSNTRHRKSYLRFDLAGSMPVATVQQAGVVLTVQASAAGSFRLYAIRDGVSGDAQSAWSSSTITWNNAPQNNTASGNGVGSGTDLVASFTLVGNERAGHEITLSSGDHPALLDAIRADTNSLVTFILVQQNTAESSAAFASSRHPTLAAPGLWLYGDGGYDWRTVRIGGGGAIPHIVAHPLVPNLFFAATDVGSPYRWNHGQQRWEPMLHATPLSTWSLGAAGNIAFDPNDASGNTLFAAVGKYNYVEGDLLKSTDRGATWTRMNLPVRVGANQDQLHGQRLVVDPVNSNVVYFLSRQDGLWRSTGAGNPGTWTQLHAGESGRFILLDPSGGSTSGPNRSARIYIHSANGGIKRSTNGGTSFQSIGGPSGGIRRGAIGGDGVLYVTTSTGVWRYKNNAWAVNTNANEYAAIAVSPHNPQHVLAARHDWAHKQSLRISLDGGDTWATMPYQRDVSEAPWVPDDYFASSPFDFAWCPHTPGRVWFSDWYFTWETQNVFAATPAWKARARGMEVGVTIGSLLSPPSGSNWLHSGVADNGGWDHKSLVDSPAYSVAGSPRLHGHFEGMGIAVQETNPNFIVRVGRRDGWNGLAAGGYSTDGGLTYTRFTNLPPNGAGGRVAVSADSTKMVWVAQPVNYEHPVTKQVTNQPGGVFYSHDLGQSWHVSVGAHVQTIGGTDTFTYTQPIAADKVNGNKFYIYRRGRLYRSTDGGASFAEILNTLPWHEIYTQVKIDTTPGVEGEVWVSLLNDGLWRSIDSGSSFQKVAAVNRSTLFSIGAASPTTGLATIYVHGRVNGEDGVFRSEDKGLTWTEISTATHRLGNQPDSMAACRRVFGRVFIGSNGDGIFVGQPAGTPLP